MSSDAPEVGGPAPLRSTLKYRYSETQSPLAGQAVDGFARKPSAPGFRETWALRAVLLLSSAAFAYSLRPFGPGKLVAVLAAAGFAALLVLAEWRLQQGSARSLLGGAIGLSAGIVITLLAVLVLSQTALVEPARSALTYSLLLTFTYLGGALGASRGAEVFLPHRAAELAVVTAQPPESIKLLDTSVLIDGRIADICEAHFLDGVLGLPQFVLHELQMVADSGDALKRQRGRRGLEILQHMQKMPQIEVRILEDSVPADLEVDDKLVELARRMTAKIITNDFNLNKVATVHGIPVLNVNLLANALKPAVLPGEPMRVLILREGKESNQGVAYLNDGTMVVVDGGRRMINKSVEVVVTSVHQTTAGKMIFGRLQDASEGSGTNAKHAAAGAGGSRGQGVSKVAAQEPPEAVSPEQS